MIAAAFVEVVARRPPPALADYVRACYSYRELAAGRVVRRKVPGGCVTVVISFEQPLLVDGRTHTSFVAGMHDRPSITEQAGLQHGLQIDLTPLGARALTGVPMHHLTNEVVPLTNVLSGWCTEQLAEATTSQCRFELLDDLIAGRLADAPAQDPVVAWAYQRLAASRGRITVSQLVKETGWTRQHLAERFRDQSG